jgi:hypothetical protein
MRQFPASTTKTYSAPLALAHRCSLSVYGGVFYGRVVWPCNNIITALAYNARCSYWHAPSNRQQAMDRLVMWGHLSMLQQSSSSTLCTTRPGLPLLPVCLRGSLLRASGVVLQQHHYSPGPQCSLILLASTKTDNEALAGW